MTGKKVNFETMNPHTLGSLLKTFLKDLVDPVFTAHFYQPYIAGRFFIENE